MPKSNVGYNKERTVTDKNNKSLCYLVIRSHFSLEFLIDGFSLRSRNSLGPLPLSLSILHIITIELPNHIRMSCMSIIKGK